ncbi:MAG: fumarate hydratase [Mesorhizobium sp.]|uniref:FumA C-terminus/TtdB family hydratase beta subunit n=1 Tax=Mesorhizobium sp. TaxID=1871066 RepID=UPI000FE88ED4|nr:FumA C-terminus/TtdB family hydratase beta subunit [Mesorhizobium sp.]RWA98685.1 MAG: fumarate hydratase [Mesorhizobium sp.]RWB10987.1 MAG: fumarate hydratase [Mesorhizobium sp.]
MVLPQAATDSTLELFQLNDQSTQYRLISRSGVTSINNGISARQFLSVSSEALTNLIKTAFTDVSHLFRASHLEQLRAVYDDPRASANDRFVALELLKNAVISAEGAFPSCQDTGTAIVLGQKAETVLVEGNMHAAICRGIAETWQTRNLRFSQMAPLTTFDERNTGTNLPAQIEIDATQSNCFEFLCIAKGGGSANKTFLYQETRRVLEHDRLLAFFDEKIRTLGTTACPPYHLAIVIGGLSADQTLKTVKLASTKALDSLPTTGDKFGRAFRDLELEEQVLDLTRNTGLGAQFGGRHFCHDVRVVRLPRHGGSLPIGMGVSCSADRQIKALINAQGFWVEKLETEPDRFLPRSDFVIAAATRIDLDQPMDEIRAKLSALPVSSAVVLSGTMIVARDLVHADLAKRLAAGETLPAYFRDHPIYYAGPAKIPQGHKSGSFGPTTAARMDPYVEDLQAAGASLVMIAKGNRSAQVVRSCQSHGGFYLGSLGGTAAVLGRDSIVDIATIDYEGFGMEAVFRVKVRDFPAFLIIDDKGNDFFTAYA